MQKRRGLKQKAPAVPHPLTGGVVTSHLLVDLRPMLPLDIFLEAAKGHLGQMVYAHRVAKAVVGRAGIQGFHSGLRHILQPLKNFVVNQFVHHGLRHIDIAQHHVLEHGLIFPIQHRIFSHTHDAFSFSLFVHIAQ